MKIKKALFSLSAVLAVCFGSCKKDLIQDTLAVNYSTPEQYNTAQRLTNFTTMAEVFENVDGTALNNAIQQGDTSAQISIMKSLASNIGNFLNDNYDSTYSYNLNQDFDGILVVGLAYLQMEFNNQINGSITGNRSVINNFASPLASYSTSRKLYNTGEYSDHHYIGLTNIEIGAQLSPTAQHNLSCVLAGVGTFLGVGEINSLVDDFMHGVSAATLVSTAKVMLRRVASAISIALAVYGIGECIGWW